jgi:hypothetical protein
MSTRVLRLVAALASLALVVGCTSEDAAFRRATREFPVLAWTGDRVFVYGGSPEVGPEDTVWPRPFADAALWDPTTGEYESIADPPFSLPLKDGAAAVVVDDSVVLVGALCATPEYLPDDASTRCDPGTFAAARYSLTDDTWEPLEAPAALATFENVSVDGLGATSDGRAVFSTADRGRRLWLVDAEGGWGALPPYPDTLRTTFGPECLVGDTVVAASRNPDREIVRYFLALDVPSPDWIPAEPNEGDARDAASSRMCPDPLDRPVSWPPGGGTEPVLSELRR